MKLSKRINRKNYILYFIASTLFTAILGTFTFLDGKKFEGKWNNDDFVD